MASNQQNTPESSTGQYLDFEKPIIELEDKIEELKHLATVQDIAVDEEVNASQRTRIGQAADVVVEISNASRVWLNL